MKFLHSTIDFYYSNKNRRLFFCFILSCIFIGVLSVFYPIHYLTNDDSSIMNVIGGHTTGNPAPYHPFINVVLGYILYFVYSVIPHVEWYTVFIFIYNIISVTVIFYSIFTLCSRRKINFAVPFFSSLFLFLSVLSSVVININFTTTSAVLGCAAVSLLLVTDYTQMSRNTLLISSIGTGMLLLSSYLLRSNCFYIIICFFLLICVYKICITLGCKNKKNTKSLAVFIVLLFILAAPICGFVNVSYEKNNIPNEVSEWNAERVSYIDYPGLTYDEAEESYKSVGWSKNFYSLTKSWYMLDEKFDTDSLKTINSYRDENLFVSVKEKTYEMLICLKNCAVEDFRSLPLTLTVVVSFLLCLLILLFELKGKKSISNKKLDLFLFIFASLGFFVFLLYFAYTGRFLHRVYFISAVPTLLIYWYLIILNSKSNEPDKTNDNKTIFLNCIYASVSILLIYVLCYLDYLHEITGIIYFVGALILASAVFLFNLIPKKMYEKKYLRQLLYVFICCILSSTVFVSGHFFFDKESIDEYTESAKETEIIRNFCIENQDKIYIHNVISTNKTLSYKQDEPCFNLFLWGGSTLYTDEYYTKLKMCNIDELYTQNLLDDNVFFIGANDIRLKYLLDYMNELYDDRVYLYRYETLSDGVDVMKFVYN